VRRLQCGLACSLSDGERPCACNGHYPIGRAGYSDAVLAQAASKNAAEHCYLNWRIKARNNEPAHPTHKVMYILANVLLDQLRALLRPAQEHIRSLEDSQARPSFDVGFCSWLDQNWLLLIKHVRQTECWHRAVERVAPSRGILRQQDSSPRFARHVVRARLSMRW